MKTRLILAALSAILIAGCNGSSDTASKDTAGGGDAKRLQIAVIPKGATHEYWKSIHEGANRAAKEFNVDILWKSPEKENDRDQQIGVVDDFVTKKVDGIVLAPLDDKALTRPVKDAMAANIPVVIIDSGLQDVKPVAAVMTDNEKAGKAGGERLAQLLNGKGKVIMLRYEVGSASTDLREKGFMEAMKENPGITVVDASQYAGATVDTAQKAAENLLQKYAPGGTPSIDGVFCPNESSAFGMLLALKSAGIAKKVKFVGFDSSDQLVAGLKAGEIDALVIQDPKKMGYEGVKAIVDAIRNKKTSEPDEDTGATVLDMKNFNDPTIQKQIAPANP